MCTTAHALRHDLCVTTVLFYFFKHILMVGGAIGREGRSGAPLQFHFYGSNDALFDQETSFRVPSVLAF